MGLGRDNSECGDVGVMDTPQEVCLQTFEWGSSSLLGCEFPEGVLGYQDFEYWDQTTDDDGALVENTFRAGDPHSYFEHIESIGDLDIASDYQFESDAVQDYWTRSHAHHIHHLLEEDSKYI